MKGGAADAIDSVAGTFSLKNAGKIIGDIEDDASGRDLIANHGIISGNVYLGGGNDRYVGTGTASAVFGGVGDDYLAGGAGRDRLHGGLGKDTLIGGKGADGFYFDDAPAAASVDQIRDFKPGLDTIVLSETFFEHTGTIGQPLAPAHFHVGAHALKAAQHILYNPANGYLLYVSDGSGGTAPVHFATLAPHLALHAADFGIIA